MGFVARCSLLLVAVPLLACAPTPTPEATLPDADPDMSVVFPAEIEVTPTEGSTALEDWRPEPTTLVPAVMVRTMDARGEQVDAPVDREHLELCYLEALGRNGEAGGSVMVYVPEVRHGWVEMAPRQSNVGDRKLERCVMHQAFTLNRSGDPTRVLLVSFRSDVAPPDEVRGAEVASSSGP